MPLTSSDARTLRNQLQILLVGFDASRRSHDLLRLRIDRRLRNQSLSLDVVSIGALRIGSDGLVGGRRSLIHLACVVQRGRLVVEVHAGVGGLCLGGLS